MKVVAILWLSIVVFISLSAGNDVFAAEVMRTIYISSSQGDDNNPGTKKMPKKTIASIDNKDRRDLHILLKAGDVFYERLAGFENCLVESYGKGDKPMLCGFKILKNIDAWKNLGNNIWQLQLDKEEDFEGYAISNATNKLYYNNVGMIYDSKTDMIMGHLVKDSTRLTNIGDIFTSGVGSLNEVRDGTFGSIMLYYNTNPKVLGNLCFSVYENGVSNLRKCHVRNVAIVGFARHGVAGIYDTTIENCRIDLIGGSILLGYKTWVRFGNGVELGVTTHPCNHCTIRRCFISRCYDTATTIQGNGKNMSDPTDMHFVENIIAYCRQAFEWYTPQKGSRPRYIDCEFSRNICFMSGNNMFGIPQSMNDCQLLSTEDREEPLRIENNIFYGGNYYFTSNFNHSIMNNQVYLYLDSYILFHYKGTKHIYAQAENAIENYKNQVGDNSQFTVLKKDSSQDLKIRKQIIKKMKSALTRSGFGKYYYFL